MNYIPLVFTPDEQYILLRIGHLVKCGEKTGICLGLNFELGKNLQSQYKGKELYEVPKIKGVRVYFPDKKKEYVHDMGQVKFVEDIVHRMENVGEFYP